MPTKRDPDHQLLAPSDIHELIEAVKTCTRAVNQQAAIMREQRDLMRKLVEHTASLPALLEILVTRTRTNGDGAEHHEEGR